MRQCKSLGTNERFPAQFNLLARSISFPGPHCHSKRSVCWYEFASWIYIRPVKIGDQGNDLCERCEWDASLWSKWCVLRQRNTSSLTSANRSAYINDYLDLVRDSGLPVVRRVIFVWRVRAACLLLKRTYFFRFSFFVQDTRLGEYQQFCSRFYSTDCQRKISQSLLEKNIYFVCFSYKV